jgi:hypothetical protein
MELGYSYILRQKGDMIFLKKEISPTSASAYSKKKKGARWAARAMCCLNGK